MKGHFEMKNSVGVPEHPLRNGGEIFFYVEAFRILYTSVNVGDFFAFGNKLRVSVSGGFLHSEQAEFPGLDIATPVKDIEFHKKRRREKKEHAKRRGV